MSATPETQQRRFDAKVSRLAQRPDSLPVSPGVVRRGLSYEALEELARDIGLTREQLAAVLGTSSRTLQRRRSRRLSPVESDRLWRVRRIYRLALEAFEGQDDEGQASEARAWLTTPKRALGGETPVAYLDTEIGTRHVEQMLAAITYTMPA